jgi:L-glutamine-phosphate cytidylyltransferase
VAKVRAALLAAGRGVRMGGEKPKPLIALDDHEPMLYYALHGLKKAGINDLLVVTGFLSSEITEFVNKHWGDEGVQFVFNARWASFGNFHSVRMALDQSPGFDLLIVNSDLTIHPDVFSRCLNTPGDLVLAVEQRLRLDPEDMRVRLDGDRVKRISKYLKMSLSQGEFCGVSLIRPQAAGAYLQVASDLEWGGDITQYYEDVYDRILAEVDVRAAEVRQGEYAEVDTPDDVPAALGVIERHREAWSES